MFGNETQGGEAGSEAGGEASGEVDSSLKSLEPLNQITKEFDNIFQEHITLIKK